MASQTTTDSEYANRQHEFALSAGEEAEVTQPVLGAEYAAVVHDVASDCPSPARGRVDRGKGIMPIPDVGGASGSINARRAHSHPTEPIGAGTSRAVIAVETNPIMQTLLARRTRQDAGSFNRILRARFADGADVVSGDLSRSVDDCVDRLREGDKEAMHRMCARKVRLRNVTCNLVIMSTACP